MLPCVHSKERIASNGAVKGTGIGVTVGVSKPAVNPFRYFNSSPEVIRLVVMMYVRYPLSLWNLEDLLFERGIGICHGTVRLWWNRFGPMFAGEVRRRRVDQLDGSLTDYRSRPAWGCISTITKPHQQEQQSATRDPR